MALNLGPRVAVLRKRFHAWWEGYDYVPDAADAAAGGDASATANPAGDVGAATADAPAKDVWTPARAHVAELIWGDGFNFPGGADAVLDLVKPFGLNKEKTLLDVGCGLGGGARTIAKELGPWVEGLEASKMLAEQGQKASDAAKLGKKAAIQHYDPRAGTLPAKRYDGILVRQTLGLVSDKASLIAALVRCLKPGGHIVFVEFALAKADANSAVLDAWRAAEDEIVAPPTLEMIADALSREKVEVRVAEDVAPRFKSQVLAGWARLAEELKGKSVVAEERPILAQELELWARRIAACDVGDLKLARVYGINPG